MKAEEKLEASMFFLGKMRESNLDRKQFIFYLDAFLSTSRSITFVLQKEFWHNPKFKCWYCKKQDEMKADKDMKYFADMRDVSIHEQSPETQTVITVSSIEPLTISDSLSYVLTREDGTKQYSNPQQPTNQPQTAPNPATQSSTMHFYFFVGRNDNDVVTLCENYIDKLFRLILEAKVLLESPSE